MSEHRRERQRPRSGAGVVEMRRVGLIGGTSWTSTVTYYSLLNKAVRLRIGGDSSAAVTIHSVDFAEITSRQRAGDWDGQGAILAAAARDLVAGGARAVAVCANTLHLVAEDVVAAIDVPFIDLIDLVAKRSSDAGWRKVGLLGTAYTMSSSMYPDRLASFGVSVVAPQGQDAHTVHNAIYAELARNVVTAETKRAYLDVIERLVDQDAEAIILGCTEIGLLLADGDASVPLLDTTILHCQALADFMLEGAGR